MTINAKDNYLEKTRYQLEFGVKDMFVEFSINSQLIFNNTMLLAPNSKTYEYNWNLPVLVHYFENGENEISVEVSSANWFDENNKIFWKKNKFTKDAYANLSITQDSRSYKNNIAQMNIFMDKKGKPISKESDVKLRKYKHKGVKKGHANRIFWTHNTYPKNMIMYKFTKKVVINGLPVRPWEKAEIYSDTKEQRSKLEKAFQELWNDINNRDIKAIKEKTKYLPWDAWAYENNITLQECFNEYFDIKGPKFGMVPIDFNDYEAKIMNNGKTVSLVNKSLPALSPIFWANITEKKGQFIGKLDGVFALIDGEFVLVR